MGAPEIFFIGVRMIENILPDIYRIEIPLTGNPMRSVNTYLIKGRNRHLLIDTPNRTYCLLPSGLDQAPVWTSHETGAAQASAK